MFEEVKMAFSDFAEEIKKTLTSRQVLKELADAKRNAEEVSGRLAALEQSIKSKKEVRKNEVKEKKIKKPTAHPTKKLGMRK